MPQRRPWAKEAELTFPYYPGGDTSCKHSYMYIYVCWAFPCYGVSYRFFHDKTVIPQRWGVGGFETLGGGTMQLDRFRNYLLGQGYAMSTIKAKLGYLHPVSIDLDTIPSPLPGVILDRIACVDCGLQWFMKKKETPGLGNTCHPP